MNTNAELLQLVVDNIKSGNKDTLAAGLRSVLNAMIASYQNLGGKDAASGYPSLDSNVKLNPDLLARTSPTGLVLDDSGTFVQKTPVFRSGGAETMLSSYSAFVYTGAGNTWVTPVLANNKVYTIFNRGSGPVQLSYPGGLAKLLDITTLTPSITYNIPDSSGVTIVDDGQFLIIKP